MGTNNDQAPALSEDAQRLAERALGFRHMFKNRMHRHGVKRLPVKRKALDIGRDIGQRFIYCLGFEANGGKVRSNCFMTFLAKKVSAPPISASHV
ncbi:MAG TPA: hypothetical protein VGG61_16025 [Gemmataceae bacterium]